MARLNFVKKARKPRKEDGIKKGDSYYWWKFRFGPMHVSKTRPKRSQLTQSSFKATLYDIEDNIAALITNDICEGCLDDIISEIENLKDEAQSSLDNMPEHLQETSTSGEMLQNRIEELESWQGELEDVDLEIDESSIEQGIRDDNTKEEQDTDGEHEARIKDLYEDALEEKKQEILDEIQNASYNGE